MNLPARGRDFFQRDFFNSMFADRGLQTRMKIVFLRPAFFSPFFTGSSRENYFERALGLSRVDSRGDFKYERKYQPISLKERTIIPR